MATAAITGTATESITERERLIGLEIAKLLRKKLEDEEMLLMLLMVAAAAA